MLIVKHSELGFFYGPDDKNASLTETVRRRRNQMLWSNHHYSFYILFQDLLIGHSSSGGMYIAVGLTLSSSLNSLTVEIFLTINISFFNSSKAILTFSLVRICIFCLSTSFNFQLFYVLIFKGISYNESLASLVSSF